MTCDKIRVDTIFFDLDGTLVDSRADIVDAVNHTLDDLGKKVKTFDVIETYIGTGVKDLMKKCFETEDPDVISKATGIFEGYYHEHSLDKTVLYPNVKDLLEYFSDKKKLIITNRKGHMAEKTLKGLGVDGYFDYVIGEDGGDCAKPSACPLDKGIGMLDADKDKTLMIGDMDIDIIAGKNAGVSTCAVTYGIGDNDDILRAGPDIIIDDILKLKDFVE